MGSAAAVGVGLLLLGASFAMCSGLVKALEGYAVGSGEVTRAYSSLAPGTRAFAEGLAFFLNWALLAAVAIGLGYRDPQRLGARVESLLALPVSIPLAFVAEIAERALFNPVLWATVFPLLATALFKWGYGYAGVALAAALTAIHGTTVAALEFALAIVLRQRLAATRLQTLRAVALGLGLSSPMLFQWFLIDLMPPIERGRIGYAATALQSFGGIAMALPGGAGLMLLQPNPLAKPGLLETGLPFVAAPLAWATALALLARVSARGLDAVTARSAGRGRAVQPSPLFRVLRGAAAEELVSVLRDKPTLVTNLVMPLSMLLGFAFLAPPQLRSPLSRTLIPVFVAAMLTTAATATLPRMGRGIWLLFTVPQTLERLVLERARVWGAVGLAAGVSVILAFWAGGEPVEISRGATLLVLLCGIPALTLCCGALTILGAQPFEMEPQHRLRTEESVNQLVLVGALAGTAAMPDAETRFKMLFFFVAIAMALWQRAREHVPFVLDRGASHVRPIDTADGLKGLLAFFALQGLLFQAWSEVRWGGSQLRVGVALTMAFITAGVMAIGLTVDPLVKQGLRLPDVIPIWSGRASFAALAGGTGLGLAGFVLALGYLALFQHHLGYPIPESWTPPLVRQAFSDPLLRIAGPVVAAPIVEEILFRGLLFVGLRRAFGVRAAIVLSALAFTLVHPQHGFGAIFALGALCAWIYHRTGLLSAAMLTHAVYNGLQVALLN